MVRCLVKGESRACVALTAGNRVTLEMFRYWAMECAVICRAGLLVSRAMMYALVSISMVCGLIQKYIYAVFWHTCMLHSVGQKVVSAFSALNFYTKTEDVVMYDAMMEVEEQPELWQNPNKKTGYGLF